ncbi:MAG: hypothetical protein ACHQHP_00160 [Bacteroidia bacterium]
MKKLNVISALSFLLVLLLSVFYFSCSKARIQTNSLKSYSPVNTYLDTKKQQEQTFIIDSTGKCPIVGNQGTKICSGKQCLMFPNGDSVTWPYIIKLVELYTPKDMIYYQMPTVASGTILKTDGEIRLRAFKNTTELVLKPSPCMAQIEMPCAAPQTGMHVFNGITTGGHPDWIDNSPVNLFSTTPNSYTASITKLGWINCGQQVISSYTSTFAFTSATDDLTNVGIFIYIPATKTVMQVYGSSSGATSGAMPNGDAVKIVCIGIDASGNLFSFYQTQTVNPSTTISVTLSATTDAALTTLLNGL